MLARRTSPIGECCVKLLAEWPYAMRFGGLISGARGISFYIGHYVFDFLTILTSLDDQQFNTREI